MPLINKIWVKWRAEEVGSDEFGNKYYLGKNTSYLGKRKRFVIYNGIDESSKVPPLWHAWLHYISDDTPSSQDEKQKHDWQKPYLPNLTGTKYAYNPANTDYKAAPYSRWQPTK